MLRRFNIVFSNFYQPFNKAVYPYIYGQQRINRTFSSESNTPAEFNGYIPINELEFTYSCSSGPGGQNVNRNKTKVEVRFHIPTATWIPEHAKENLMKRECNRINKDQYFIIASDRTRKQLLNQADCLERIRRIVRECVDSMKKVELKEDVLENIRIRNINFNEERLKEKKMLSLKKYNRYSHATLDDL